MKEDSFSSTIVKALLSTFQKKRLDGDILLRNIMTVSLLAIWIWYFQDFC